MGYKHHFSCGASGSSFTGPFAHYNDDHGDDHDHDVDGDVDDDRHHHHRRHHNKHHHIFHVWLSTKFPLLCCSSMLCFLQAATD